MKYPIGIQSFDQIIEGGFVYVDKTDMVYKLVTEGKIYFLGRPRRFGKRLVGIPGVPFRFQWRGFYERRYIGAEAGRLCGDLGR